MTIGTFPYTHKLIHASGTLVSNKFAIITDKSHSSQTGSWTIVTSPEARGSGGGDGAARVRADVAGEPVELRGQIF